MEGSSTNAVPNVRTTTREHSREARLRTNPTGLIVKGQKCFDRLSLLNNGVLIYLKHRTEAYQLGQITKEQHK